jgi:hypothetical protein
LPLDSRQASSESLFRLGDTAGELLELFGLLLGALLIVTFGVGDVGREPRLCFEIPGLVIDRLAREGDPT